MEREELLLVCLALYERVGLRNRREKLRYRSRNFEVFFVSERGRPVINPKSLGSRSFSCSDMELFCTPRPWVFSTSECTLSWKSLKTILWVRYLIDVLKQLKNPRKQMVHLFYLSVYQQTHTHATTIEEMALFE